jgi:hypothetical protein
VRPGPIGDDDNGDRPFFVRRRGDEGAAAETLVVRMRRDDEKPAVAEQGLRIGVRKLIGGLEEIVRIHD